MTRFALILILSVVLPFAACAEESRFQEGKQYVRFAQALPVTSSKIEVLEFFSYGCPHCYSFEPYFKKWVEKVSANVEVKQIPSVMSRSGLMLAQAFYAAQELGVFERVHAALFKAVQVERRPLNTEENLMVLIKELGIDEKEFLTAMKSFQVDTNVRYAMQIIRKYRVTGVPAVAVNGRYLTGGGMAGTFAELTDVLDYLVAQEMAAGETKNTVSAKNKAASIN
ncbi:MAG: thiol:disulfide interchange protein DsbA/DsbL [Gammaproteobacteria bacterium]|nr:thiol:disulfide interchange protein DsbA/DsbL [Gammaproteobacteria bacterium]